MMLHLIGQIRPMVTKRSRLFLQGRHNHARDRPGSGERACAGEQFEHRARQTELICGGCQYLVGQVFR